MDKLSPENSAKLSALKAKLFSFHHRIKDILDHGRLIANDKSKLFLFKGMYKQLTPYFNEFNSTWNEIVEFGFLFGLSKVFPSEDEKKLQVTLERYYYESCAIYEEHANPAPPPGASTTASTSAVLNTALNESRSVRARLPEINLPRFDGSYADWPLFRDTYTSLIHDEVTLADIEKFHFLLSCLSGPALALVKGVPVSGTNYTQAWKLLTDNYEDKRRLANCHLKTVLSFAPFQKKPSPRNLKQFLTTVVEAIASYRLLKIPHSEDFILLFLVLRCLDPQTRKEFERKHSSESFPSYDSLICFLKSELRSLELSNEDFDPSHLPRTQVHDQKTSSHPFLRSRTRSALFTERDARSSERETSTKRSTGPAPTYSGKSLSCPACRGSHTVYQCIRFKSATPQERLNFLRNWQGCTNCLSAHHRKGQCTSERTCHTCHLRHHSWLHIPLPDKNDGVKNRPIQDTPQGVTLTGTSNSMEVILGTALIHILDSNGSFQPIRVVVDCGSQHSFLTSSCAQQLGLKSSHRAPAISGIGQVHLPKTAGQINCVLRSRFGKHQFTTSAVIVQEITGNLPHSPIPFEFHHCLQAYNLADPTYWKPQPIDFLLGADLYFDVITGGPVDIRPGFPKLIPSLFGHIVAGKCEHGNHPEKSTSLFVRTSSDLQNVMSKFWEIEEVPREVPWSDEERECERHFLSTHYRLPTGRFVVSFPFKPTINLLRSPTQHVEGRFKKLEYRLDRNPSLKSEYHSFMDEYLLLGHMSLAPNPGKYLIPHHCVTKQEGTKSKMRVVFDASCKGPNGSLNCHLMVGPKLQSDICDIVLNFRIRKFVLVADIVKMYRQILMRPEDRIYQHVLWRSDPMDPVTQYQLNTVTYGIASSAYLAIRSLQQLAKEDGQEFPLAAQALLNDVYVDDIVSGADSIEEATLLQSQLIELLKKGCFELSKWKSNHEELLKLVQQEDQESSFELNPCDVDTGCKILGLQWEPASDVMTFHIYKPTAPSTKRGILSTIARIYDPLGYLAPVVFQAKVILQAVWLAQCDWDAPVPEITRRLWENFAERLPDLSGVRIPRFVDVMEGKNRILGFADASQRGYAAVLYLHTRTPQGHHTYLLKSKTKLAPTKLTTIPRLELCAALLLTRLISSCSSFISKVQPDEVLLFTDSTIVLGWLNTPVGQLKAFVAHRIAEILESSQLSSWHHVDSTSNPADCASRGLMPNELPHHHLWWTGPSWLSDLPSHWPICQPNVSSSELPELKPIESTSLLATQLPTILDWIERSSSYMKVLRSLSYAMRFLKRARGIFPVPEGRTVHPITLKEIDESNYICIRLIQKEHLPPINVMQTSKPWKSFSPILDSRGLIRVGGRLQYAHLSYDAKHPLILPRCHFTRLLVQYYHRIFLHVGPTSLQAMIQGRYCIASARKLIRSCVRQCVTCQRANPKAQLPMMGNIPTCRLQEGQVFQNVGVDLGGPFPLKESSRRKAALGKGYLCLFICMVTKALHLEVVSSCSTEAFLAALNRFIARRGKPLNIYSDCGTNFVGASAALKELYCWYKHRQTQDEIYDFASARDIHWHMIPPRAPHFGGLWEAGIKLAKSLLAKNLSSTPLTFEELSTLFCRIEAVLNSRPLCPLSEDSEAIDCLTPGHFLIGRPLIAIPEKSLLNLKENTLGRWQLIHQRVQHFWTRWRLEFLNQLQQRKKWTTSSTNLNEGDLVIVKDESPLATWPLARVVATHPGKDGIIRVATIRTTRGIYKRPVVKLVPLYLSNLENSI